MSVPTLADVDRDEALTEAIAELFGSTRAGFLRDGGPRRRRHALGARGPSDAAAEIGDVDILNFGLRFERLQATFYTQADEMGTIASMSAAKRGGRAPSARTSART